MEFETKIRVYSYLLALTSITLGGLIYLAYRPLTLLMFDVLQSCHLMEMIAPLRSSCPPIPDWAMYSLPDGLWVFTYIVYIGTVNHFRLTTRCKLMLPVLPAIGICSELLQYWGLMPGTFDVNDLAVYAIGTVSGLAYIRIAELVITKRTFNL